MATAAMSVSRPNRSTTPGPEAPVSTAAIAPTTTNEPAKVIVDGPDSSPAAVSSTSSASEARVLVRPFVTATMRDGTALERMCSATFTTSALSPDWLTATTRVCGPSIAVRKCRSSAESSITAAMPPRASSATAG